MCRTIMRMDPTPKAELRTGNGEICILDHITRTLMEAYP